MTRNLAIPLILFLASLGLPENSRAGTAGLTLEVVTDLPLQAGGRVNLELADGLYVHSTLGGMPEAYIALINTAVVDLGGYSSDTGVVVTSTLKDSLVWRVHGGWSPRTRDGWYASFGYTLVTLGGGVNGEELLRLATQESLDSASATHVYTVDSTLHMLDVEVGWRLTLLGTYTVRFAAGFSGTLSATTQVATKFTPIGDTAAKAHAFTQSVETFLDSTYERNVFTPTLSVAIGVRLM